MVLLENESVLSELGNKLTLTTHRVRYESETFGGAETKSIMLEELSSCAMVRTSHIILLVAALLVFLVGLFVWLSENNKEFAIIIGASAAAVLIIAYLVTRWQVPALESAGTTITLNTHGSTSAAIELFIEATEAAKNIRYLTSRT